MNSIVENRYKCPKCWENNADKLEIQLNEDDSQYIECLSCGYEYSLNS